MVERRIAEDGSMLAEGLSGAIPPESFGTGRVCIEPSCEVRLSRVQQHRLVRAPREPGGHRPPLRHLDPPPRPSPQLPSPHRRSRPPDRSRPRAASVTSPGASVHCVADTGPAGSGGDRDGGPPMTERLDGTVALVTGASSGIGEATAVGPGRRRVPGWPSPPAGATGWRPWPTASAVTRCCPPDRRDRRGPGPGDGAADRRRLRPPRHPRQQRRRDAARPHRRRPGRGVAPDGRAQPARPPLLHPRRPAPPAGGGRRRDPASVADVVNVSSVAGRFARTGNGVYNATKFGVAAFSESLRQEVTTRHVRVSLVEPGATATELVVHNRPEVLEQLAATFGPMETLESEDIADAIAFTVTRPRRMDRQRGAGAPDRTGALSGLQRLPTPRRTCWGTWGWRPS